jgi:hypothetical protein
MLRPFIALPRRDRRELADAVILTIGIEDLGLAEPGERFAEGIDAEPRRQGVRQTPGQNTAGLPSR